MLSDNLTVAFKARFPLEMEGSKVYDVSGEGNDCCPRAINFCEEGSTANYLVYRELGRSVALADPDIATALGVGK